MNNVLVTGANGFIAKNLISKLEASRVKILKCTRKNTLDEFKALVLQSDFIFHFAGEVKPNSSDEEFQKSNVGLTKYMIEIIENSNKKIPILFASSIHAKLLKNEYGKTKRESEIIIEKYSNKNVVQCCIYRLPHVFGEGCKPNYNSVVSTWIYNSINNLEINVFDRNIKMSYVYVQDIILEFLDKLNKGCNLLYVEPSLTYNTTLGDIVDYIQEFKDNVNNSEYKISSNEFKKKLYLTYSSYCK